MNFKLTWHEARKCWKKYSGGKTYYLGKGKCRAKYDSTGYNTALDEWRKIDDDLRAEAKATEMFESDPKIAEKVAIAYQKRIQWMRERRTR